MTDEQEHPHCPDDHCHDGAAATAVPGPAAAAGEIHAAHALRVAIGRELDALCINPAGPQCRGCAESESCDRMLSSLLIRLINAANEHQRAELALINQYRGDAALAQPLAEHVASHNQLINDLSAYVMDWGRVPPGELLSATAELLRYWNEVHFALHDGILLSLAAGRPGWQQ